MNVLFVSNSYIEPGKPSTGLPNYLRRVTLSLITLGHKATILYSASYSQHRFEGEVEIYAVRVPAHIRGFKERFLCEGYYLNEKVEELSGVNSYDIIQFASIGGIPLFYKGSVPSVMRLSSYAKTYFSTYTTLTREQVDIMSELERKASENADGIFAPCSVTAVSFGKDVHRNVDVIESPFVNDVVEYDFSIYNEKLNGKKYVLFFGTLYIEKGIKVIGQIISKFLDSNPKHYFVAVGEDRCIDGVYSSSYLKECAGKYAERVEIISEQPHSILYPIIQHADFVILPSLMDNLPNACIEAMYFSKIVIGTDGASFEQLIEDGCNGFLCNIGDASSLYDKMIDVVRLDKDEKEKIESRASERIRLLSPDNIVKRLIDYYASIIESHNKKHDLNWNDILLPDCSKFDFDKNCLMSELDKLYLQRRLLYFWTEMQIRGRHLSDRLKSRGIKSVSLYGAGDIGRLVIEELNESEISVVCAIDRQKANSLKVPIVSVGDDIPSCDAIIVTPINEYFKIAEDLSKVYSGMIISVEDLIFTE